MDRRCKRNRYHKTKDWKQIYDLESKKDRNFKTQENSNKITLNLSSFSIIKPLPLDFSSSLLLNLLVLRCTF